MVQTVNSANSFSPSDILSMERFKLN